MSTLKTGSRNVSAEELDLWLREDVALRLVDVRAATEYAAGHVPGAMNVPLEQMPIRQADMGRERLVLICQGGVRAGLACEALNDRSDVYVLNGGTQAWAQAGLPLQRCQPTGWSLERQVRLIVGVLAVSGATLALTTSPLWAVLPLLLGVGLTFAGITDICGLGILLARMPWNRQERS